MALAEMVGDVVNKSTALPPSINGFHLEPRCRVCRDDEVRKKVNDLLATGSSYAMVLHALGEDKATLGKCDRVTIDSIHNHAARHFPVQNVAKATYREIVERRAQEAQIDFVDGVATALTPLAFYEVVMNEGFRQLVDGDMNVSVDTGLRAAEKLQALTDARAGETDVASLRVQVGRIIEIVRTFIPRERWPEVQAALRGDPSIRRQQQSSPVEGIRMVAVDDTAGQDDD